MRGISDAVFNPDGAEVSMCGNGARCIARFAVDLGLVENRFKIETAAGVLEAQLNRDQSACSWVNGRKLHSIYALQMNINWM